MAALLDFRRRIRSVKNIQQVTRAMKFVSAARLRKAQEKAMEARPYANAITQLVRSVASRMENPTHPLLARRPEEKILLVVATGDRGLAGAFNANAVRRAVEFLRSQSEKHLEVIPVGRKGRDAFRRINKWTLAGEYVGFTARVEFPRAQEIAAKITEQYSDARVDAVYLLFNEFKSVITQKMVFEKLLPMEPAEPDASGSQVDYIYEQPAEEILKGLLPRFVEARIYRMIADSSAAEHAARMTAMDSATNNAGELIQTLTLTMNKIRQAAITKEIIEVVSGASYTA
ncbi:MAG TPA: ATP synthase F1 subunit gamma [Candidatus Acidoferrales bacterium]|jgi:F-type H+-transporting ATPase subunit gamma|nr:ATP synthase F1 subunit gamma [Candidatus Acidoferrales bacterium]